MVVYESFLAVPCPWTEPAYMYVQVLSPQKRAQDAAPSPVSYHNPYTGFKSNEGITSRFREGKGNSRACMHARAHTDTHKIGRAHV